MANDALVITSIYPPTEAVRAAAGLEGYDLIVIGDRKTPDDWSCPGAEYYSPERQLALDFELARRLPFNQYPRKMIGYLLAAERGAPAIAETDDDNVSSDGWRFPDFSGRFRTLPPGRGFVNVYSLFTDQKIWPRGFPLNLILQDGNLSGSLGQHDVRVGMWQGLADGDPDVDAIYRLTSNEPCIFRKDEPVVLQEGTVCPCNTQATKTLPELYELLYLPSTVTMRFTDILRGLVAQPLMWARGYCLGFAATPVFQDRNAHDYMRDFADEIPVYLHSEAVIDIAAGALKSGNSLGDDLHDVYGALAARGIVQADELAMLEVWLNDLARARAR